MTNSSFKVEQWRSALCKSGCAIASIAPLATITKKNGDPLFSLLDVAVTSPEGHPLPHVVFIRGNAVIVVPLLKNVDTGEERYLMVRQRRIGNGLACLEFPAGMIDAEHDDPADVALRELFEETGLHIDKQDLFMLAPYPLYSSAGASDEAVFYFGCVQHLTNAAFVSFNHKICGNSDEHEYLTVTLLSRAEAEPQVTSIQARLGFYLFEQHSHEKNITGKIGL